MYEYHAINKDETVKFSSEVNYNEEYIQWSLGFGDFCAVIVKIEITKIKVIDMK